MVQAWSILVVIFAAVFTITNVSGHGNMVLPINWFDYPEWMETKDGWILDYAVHQQCTAGSQIPRENICPGPLLDCGGYPYPVGASCMWFNVNGCMGGTKCGQDQGGFAYGPKAEDVDFVHDIFVTSWTRGDVVEVAWSIQANHGGGYSYRLCKLPEEGKKGLTEKCFQQTPLEFYGDKQWAQYREDKSTRIEFTAVRTNQGTTPPGSQWTKNPIPPCNGLHGGFHDVSCTKGTQFPPPAPSLYGFGVDPTDFIKSFGYSIIDKVKIPKDLEPGNYVISFRWDCAQASYGTSKIHRNFFPPLTERNHENK